MGARARRTRSPKEPPPPLSLNGDKSNGKANGNGNGNMNGNVEMRRGRGGQDPASVVASHNFTLDDPVPKSPAVSNVGFSDLPPHDKKNFLLLVMLYFLQGIPMGLATGSVPFLLKKHLSYTDIGIFSLASYPYSLKLLWSPFVDAIWSSKFGRRKTWIVPIQFLSGFGMLYLGSYVEDMMLNVGKPDVAPTAWSFMLWWFFLVLMCATQDIAVDGWALTLLTPSNVSYASTAQTVGLTAGSFMSYTVFLALRAPEFANKWIRKIPIEDEGLITLGGYLKFWGWAYIIITIGLGFLKKEENARNEDGVWDVYRIMWGILKLKNVQTIIIVHLIAKIGFQANDGVTNLKLLDKGFGQDNMALTVLIDFPFEIAVGYYAGVWSQNYTPMRLWCWGFVGRLGAALIAQFVVSIFPRDGVNAWYFILVIGEHVFSTFTNTVMFVAVSAFHAKVSDPVIGGTYMTLLATVSNLGGTFPRYWVLQLVDKWTSATCHPHQGKTQTLEGPLITEPFSCALQPDRERCVAGGGSCELLRDGYYYVNILCVAFGAATFFWYIRPRVLQLQGLPQRAWRLSSDNKR